MPSSLGKRQKEKDREERRRDKERKRTERRHQEKVERPADGEDPDIAGIVPGPQPVLEE